MADTYGGLEIPVPVPETSGPTYTHPEIVTGDPLIGNLAHFLYVVIRAQVQDAWNSIHPAQPVVKRFFPNDPEDIFNEEFLPGLFVYRPGRETREQVEAFEQTADDYRFQKSRVECWWILDNAQIANQRARNQMIDTVRKVIDRAIMIGRDLAWLLPEDTDPTSPSYDPKAVTQGSSLAYHTGAATIELVHASPADFVRKMNLPAQPRRYQSLKMSFYIEELLVRDVGDETTVLDAQYVSPDQGTGLGPFDLGDAEYT